MDEVIKDIVTRKLRKRGKAYQLSDNSQLATADFGYANKITSRLYKLVTATLDEMSSRKVYAKLLKAVQMLVRNDEVHELGQLRIGYGNILPMKGIQFNARQSWSNYVPWSTAIDCNVADANLQVLILPSKAWLSKTYHPRVTRLSVHYHIYKIPFELQDEVALLSSKELICKPGQELPERKANFSIAGWDNCLILVVGVIRSYLKDIQGSSDFQTVDKSFLAAEILEVYGLRDGQLIVERQEQPVNPLPPVADSGVDWE